jgi:ATP phosphoribosyltransferase regulatory subunit
MFDNKKNDRFIKLPSGTRDILTPEADERNEIKKLISREFRLWGYGEVSTPVFEYTKNISVGAGKNWKEKLINFFDVDGNPLSLRSDMTIPIARLAGMRIKENQLPSRFCYFADSFRQSGVQKGARRVYNQAGLELIGFKNSLMADVEILIILINILNELNVRDYKIGLGHVEFIEGLSNWLELDTKERDYIRDKVILKDFVALESFLEKRDREKAEIFIKLLQPESSIDRVDSLISEIDNKKIARSFNYIKELNSVLARLNYEDYFISDFSIIRDFDYYTGLLFEVYCPALNDIIGSGGRYDRLIKKFGKDIPATGFALDIDLVHKAVGGLERKGDFKILLKLEYSLNMEDYVRVVQIAQKLHKKGIIVEILYEDKSGLESFAAEKKYDLLVEIESNFENLKIFDVKNNSKKVEEITSFIEGAGKR